MGEDVGRAFSGLNWAMRGEGRALGGNLWAVGRRTQSAFGSGGGALGWHIDALGYWSRAMGGDARASGGFRRAVRRGDRAICLLRRTLGWKLNAGRRVGRAFRLSDWALGGLHRAFRPGSWALGGFCRA